MYGNPLSTMDVIVGANNQFCTAKRNFTLGHGRPCRFQNSASPDNQRRHCCHASSLSLSLASLSLSLSCLLIKNIDG